MRVGDIVDRLLRPYSWIDLFDTDTQKIVFGGDAIYLSEYKRNYIVDTLEVIDGTLWINAHHEKIV